MMVVVVVAVTIIYSITGPRIAYIIYIATNVFILCVTSILEKIISHKSTYYYY